MSHQKALTKQVFTLIDVLWSYGMEEVVISPGSRSTPIAIAAELHPSIRTHVHPDERSAAFFALGLAKAERNPVGLICTSGTAAANYTPAIAEAGLSHIPLIALTADRPHELREIGAPQSISQNNMYSNYVKFFTELPLADTHKSLENLIESKMLQCSRFFTGPNTGPVHVNIPVREPSMPDVKMNDLFNRKKKALPDYKMADESMNPFQGTGLLLIGETREDVSGIGGIIDRENLTVIIDPRQHLRKFMKNAVTHHDLIFNALSEAQYSFIEENVDFILRVGEPLTSKAANKFLSSTNVPQYVLSELQEVKTYPVAPVATYIGNVPDTLERIGFSGGKPDFKKWMTHIDDSVTRFIDENISGFTDEGRFTYDIIQKTEPATNFFLSSSMPIRDVERYDTLNVHSIYSNRGANGIDGVVSTALGMAMGRPVTLIIGDVALYHDMNGLLMSRLEGIDINIIVFNNNGGGIFSFLPQYADKDHFERLFGTPLDIDFSHAAALYDFDHVCITDVGELDMGLLNRSGRNMIEIKTDRDKNLLEHQKLKEEIGKMVTAIGT
ncbi:MAG TPA: 2-succinyl-5-enolpyruvyl-6-hydroxy-3-cyclohexene-1-carboxylic-acid synthase [Candidatus Salinicoccus stercoripullorum]|uniref:2-succinyl-5-enolpyruvyl-6-hydroxy-3-cyclohexene-1-carboxylate synthase n=1 Tax=Candidatus Salinicoccus stercoripullorum TaxID=2838756 RepID=A0A9D1QIB6_9STAP|nr:2-succinyl-5-enolpyruvyl-6-hydroxy-3-cyclohexene-1-carboxylic-acid synthase [Candidatus Salinicoccus stercoripullorum]